MQQTTGGTSTMETNWLEDFLKLAEEGNFSRAAEARNSSQPAFSRRIRGLEDWVGTKLIDRDTHRIALTEAGETFRTVAEDVLRRLAQGRDQAREVGGAEAGTLRFAATHALSLTFFPDWLRDQGDDQDLATVSLLADNMQACEKIMLAGKADFLLCHHHPSSPHRLEPGGFLSIRLGEDRLVPVCLPEADGRARFALPGRADEPLPYLAYDDRSGMGRILAAAQVICERHAALRPVFRSHLATALLRMARDGKGIAWAPHSLCAPDLASGRLVRAGSEDWDVPMEIHLFRPRARQGHAVETFWSRALAATGPRQER
ncbi:LysR family transcriptional regulator [Stappia sp.]|uniref:LysR family transcriptional regulator n=1 Tax=Stappia sp. TaxID=1870903 RepID=UPI003C7E98A2